MSHLFLDFDTIFEKIYYIKITIIVNINKKSEHLVRIFSFSYGWVSFLINSWFFMKSSSLGFSPLFTK